MLLAGIMTMTMLMMAQMVLLAGLPFLPQGQMPPEEEQELLLALQAPAHGRMFVGAWRRMSSLRLPVLAMTVLLVWPDTYPARRLSCSQSDADGPVGSGSALAPWRC